MKRAACVVSFVALSACAPEYVVWRHGDVRVVEHARAQHVVSAERAFATHAAVASDAVAVSKGHVAYAARDGKVWHVYRDDVAEPGAWDGIGALALDGGSLAYAAERGGRWYVVVQGKESAPFDEIAALGLSRGGHAAFVAEQNGAYRAFDDGVPGSRTWRAVRDVVVADDLSFIATDDAGEHVVRGGDVSPAFDAILERTHDGFLARALEKNGRVAYAFGREIGRGEIERLATSVGHFAYAELGASGESAVHDGRRDPIACEAIDSLSLSGDGEHVGYSCKKKSTNELVVDGAVVGTFDWARAPVFASHGAYAFVASLGAGAFIRSSSAAPRSNAAFDVVIEDSLALSDDGTHWAIIAGFASVRRLYTIVDGRPIAPFDLDAWVGEELRLGAHMTPAKRSELLAAHTRDALSERARASR